MGTKQFIDRQDHELLGHVYFIVNDINLNRQARYSSRAGVTLVRINFCIDQT